MKTFFTEDTISTLVNICHTAADKFEDNAKQFDTLAAIDTPPEGALYPTGKGAQRLAEQFRGQALEAHGLAQVLQAIDWDSFDGAITVPVDEEMIEPVNFIHCVHR